MASNISKIPLMRAVTSRGYATCPAIPVCGNPNYEIKNTTLPNKTVVASAENEAPISRISIVFRAGSRNETPDNSGVTHTLRICAGLTTKNASQFAITRNIQQVGASLTCTSDRELISYTLEGTRKAIEKTLPFLTEVATKQVFRPWEVSETVPRQRLELATRPPQLRAVDLLHKAAFRGRGLGNSLYSAKYQLGNISTETLQHYVGAHFTAEKAGVLGLGVDHLQLVDYAESLKLESGSSTPVASPYCGGEIRSDKAGGYAYIAIGGQAAGANNLKEAMAFAVLQHALGAGPKIKWAPRDNGVLSKAAGGDQVAIGAGYCYYSDAGLLTVLIAGPADQAGKTVEGVVKVLKAGNLSDGDVNRGKNQLKALVLSQAENGSKALADMGFDALILGTAGNAAQWAAHIDSVTTSDVNAALKKAGSGKISIASYGNLRSVPYLDELK